MSLATVAAPDLLAPLARLGMLADRGVLHPGRVSDGAAWARLALDGVDAVAFATDPRVQGGALGAAGCAAVVSAYDEALARGLPIVGVWQSGGARLREGAAGLHAVGTVFAAMTRASGTVPQVSLVLGPAAGGAAYGPALTDVVVLGPEARVFVTGPDVVRSVTGEDIDAVGLGGPALHGTSSGVAHVTAGSDDEAREAVRRIVGLLARPARPGPLPRGLDPDPSRHLPESRRRAYDVRPVLADLLDPGPTQELHSGWARNVVTTLGRLHGRAVGVLATNPLRLGGCLDGKSSDKAARFVRLCDSLGVPLVVVVDVPGYLPGSGQEADGVVRRGAKLLHAFAAARVPRVTLVTRKAYGGAYIALNSRSLGATRVLAWPGAEVDVMSPVAAVRVLHRRALAAVPEDERPATELALAAAHAVETGGLDAALAAGLVDEVVEPAGTRVALARALADAPAGRGRLTNIPL